MNGREGKEKELRIQGKLSMEEQGSPRGTLGGDRGCRCPRLMARASAWGLSFMSFSLGCKCYGENPEEGSLCSVSYMGSPEQRMLQVLLPKRAHSSGAHVQVGAGS